MWLLLLAGCLVNTDLYETRKAELSDADRPSAGGDGTDSGDADADGFTVEQGDCDDADASVFPGADEVPYDGVDNDCEGGDLVDVDGDGEPAEAAGGGDCDDADPSVFPGADETWDNGITDNDCDGEREAVTASFADTAVVGASAGGQFGRRIAPFGDANGDGVAEFLVAAPYESTEVELGGAVYLVDATAGTRADAFPTLYHPEEAALLSTVAGGPDVDGDGVPDAVVAATNLGEGTGAAWFVSGAVWAAADTANVEAVAGARINGVGPGTYFGGDATFFGDVDGDGQADVGISASLMAAAEPAAGMVGVWTAAELADGTVTDTEIVDANALYSGWFEDQRLGGRNDMVGDLDGDGYDDMLLSGRGVLGTVVPGGARPADPDEDALFQLVEGRAGDQCEVKMLGDVDGDGERDLGCSFNPGPSFLLFTDLQATPTRTTLDPTTTVRLEEGSFVFDLVNLGDLDGDGREETLLPTKWNEERRTSTMTVLFGEDVIFSADYLADELALQTVSSRPSAGYGYRVFVSDDVSGDGVPDIVTGTGGDSEAGIDAGGVTWLSVPR